MLTPPPPTPPTPPPDRFDGGRLRAPRPHSQSSHPSIRRASARAWPHPAEHGTAHTLVETERGSLRRCSCCGGLELRFGNAILGLTAEDLGTVHSALVEAELSAGDRGDILLLLRNNSSGWVFDRPEAAELRQLLVRACILLDG